MSRRNARHTAIDVQKLTAMKPGDIVLQRMSFCS